MPRSQITESSHGPTDFSLYLSGRSGDAYKLSDLQHYIVQFPSSHYSQAGKEPLLYATVLLLSLQFKAAVAFLAKDASASGYRLDAPHFAIALLHHQVHPLQNTGTVCDLTAISIVSESRGVLQNWLAVRKCTSSLS